MRISVRQKHKAVILDIVGNVDINASELVETVGTALSNKISTIIFNFENVNLVDYVGVSIIAVVYKNILNHGGSLRLYNIPSHVAKLFSIVGLDRVFYYYNSQDEALAAAEEEKQGVADQQPMRRRFKRISLNAPIEYREKFSKAVFFYTGKVINLSAEGAFVVGEQLFLTGDVLLVRLHLMPQPGLVSLEACVSWVADRQIQAYDYPGMGLEFCKISSRMQEMIIQFVEQHLTGSMP